MIRADKGDTVKVQYTGKLADGTVFDTSPEEKPLHIIIGKGEVIPGFEEALEGMYMLEEKTVTMGSDKAYGPHDPKLSEQIRLDELPEGLQLQVGKQLEITAQTGNKLLVMVTGLADDTVTLDGNHPLAGKDLTFDIKLLAVDKKPAA